MPAYVFVYVRVCVCLCVSRRLSVPFLDFDFCLSPLLPPPPLSVCLAIPDFFSPDGVLGVAPSCPNSPIPHPHSSASPPLGWFPVRRGGKGASLHLESLARHPTPPPLSALLVRWRRAKRAATPLPPTTTGPPSPRSRCPRCSPFLRADALAGAIRVWRLCVKV